MRLIPESSGKQPSFFYVSVDFQVNIQRAYESILQELHTFTAILLYADYLSTLQIVNMFVMWNDVLLLFQLPF